MSPRSVTLGPTSVAAVRSRQMDASGLPRTFRVSRVSSTATATSDAHDTIHEETY
jgi:hypothetical protein